MKTTKITEFETMIDNLQDKELKEVLGSEYTGFYGEQTKADKIALLKATQQCTGKIADVKEITVKAVLIKMVRVTDTETKDKKATPRTILITPEGDSYFALGWGVYSSLKQMLDVLGDVSDWDEMYTLEVLKNQGENKNQTRLAIK